MDVLIGQNEKVVKIVEVDVLYFFNDWRCKSDCICKNRKPIPYEREKMIGKFSGEYRWLSNFEKCSVVLDNVIYPSIEHAYQSAKNDSPKWKFKCKNTFSAGQIKKEAKNVELIKDWDKKKILIMANLINQKFNKEPFKTLLLNTGDEYIQEGNYWGDSFWGVDLKTGIGKNILGKMIMLKRKALIDKSN